MHVMEENQVLVIIPARGGQRSAWCGLSGHGPSECRAYTLLCAFAGSRIVRHKVIMTDDINAVNEKMTGVGGDHRGLWVAGNWEWVLKKYKATENDSP
jgi:hypothetical protein